MVIVLMGVAGSGKTTIGEALATRLSWPFYDADGFHPAENIEKMSRGIALTDRDRDPWLAAIRNKIDSLVAQNRSAILGCSALKEEYRQRLREGHPEVELVYLTADYSLIHSRIAARPGHFFKKDLLKSQFDDLEEPRRALSVSAAQRPDQIVEEIVRRLSL